MAKPPLPEKVSELLARPNPSVITSVRPDGQPVSVATWYLWEDGRVLVNMDEGRKRLEYMRADPRVTLTVLSSEDWYTHVSLQGRVAELVDDPELTDIDRLARHYTGDRYPVRERHRISARIEIVRWHGWGAAENTDVTHH
ncbi:PPOX class probable F420-dependent enzyme [Halopolyspora algeriensis]|uniref:PPOX class probable F420-dependent enzyme n=1 Tax=Halopolyspora algeriensis TaxID=1500506 RepID=A0A368VS55_9ACTN|nr:PPOX class F420-dependent oxidoreductase [Halopolyspora algeriensis]RCW44515.1 PPOX class probable F420-dependent enzyme [Halopolyspora algeriensis]TQM55875.1 PPOX class probable F420-dependent enzyme [Halopolyspora algeriensis]